MTTPPLSVCLTSYKRGYVIANTIESILAQTFGDFELVICDDDSRDETEEVCRKYERLDKRVRFIGQPTNVGMPANLQTAIAATSAPLIANLHDGDTFHPTLLEKWKLALDTHSDAAFAFCQVVHLDRSGVPCRTRAPNLPELIPQKALVEYMLSPAALFDSPVWGTVMGRRRAYEEVGGFESRYSFYSDVAMWMRLNLRYPVAYIAEPLMFLKVFEPGRPWEITNWTYPQICFDIYQEAVDGLYAGFPVKIAQERRRLRRRRDSSWLKALGSCIKRDRLPQLEDAIEIFAADDSLPLRGSAAFACCYLAARRRFPALHSAVEMVAKFVR
jgi:glycosyltransferase involved in cell wall biosynthesis